jgi:hypothetical protein
MNATVLEPARWPLRRWIYSFLAVFLVQVGLIWLLGERVKIPPPPVPLRTTIHLAADPWSAKQLSDLPTIGDPTLFVLPNLHGFSAAAWLNFKPQEYPLADWTEEPRWLTLNPKALGQTFVEFMASNVPSPLLIANQAMPRSVVSDLNVPNPATAAQSQLRVEGDLARRPLVTPLELPPWPHSDLLTNTVVQAVVDAEGLTFSTTLLVSCGYREADQFAMNLIAGARFQPIAREKRSREDGEPLTWGKVIFQWHTLPLPASNASTTPP